MGRTKIEVRTYPYMSIIMYMYTCTGYMYIIPYHISHDILHM